MRAPLEKPYGFILAEAIGTYLGDPLRALLEQALRTPFSQLMKGMQVAGVISCYPADHKVKRLSTAISRPSRPLH